MSKQRSTPTTIQREPASGGDTHSAQVNTSGPMDAARAFSMQGAMGNSGLQGMVQRSGAGASASSDPGASMDSATSGAGEQTPYRAEMEAAFGQDFSNVQAYTGQSGPMSDIGANAAARGEQVAFKESSPGRETVAHELTHVVQNRQSGGGGIMGEGGLSNPSSSAELEASSVARAVVSTGVAPEISASPGGAVQRDGGTDVDVDADEEPEVDQDEVDRSVSNLEDLLSYGAFDWAITDSEAWAALGILAGLEIQNLQATLSSLDQTFITRLLDNLPDAARQSSAYGKVLVAMGPEKVKPYLTDLLSYGLFDWAITDAEIALICQLIMASPEQAPEFVNALSREQQRTLLEQLPDSLNNDHKGVLRVMFFGNIDSDFDFGAEVFEARFKVALSGTGGNAWDADSLKRSYTVLEGLPEGHVRGNPEFLNYIRTGAPANNVGGAFNNGQDAVKMTFDTSVIDTLTETRPDTTDPLYGVNRFDKVVRHEVGHAVDAQIGGIAKYCLGKASGGNWIDYNNDYSRVAREMVAASQHVKDLTADQQAAVVSAMSTAMGNRNVAGLPEDLFALPALSGLSDDEKDEIRGDRLWDALTAGMGKPFMRNPTIVDLGGRVYQESYDNVWTSYAEEARSRKVSTYQFRHPWEWFAEAYAAYYEPTEADGTTDHSVLGGVDSATKRAFDTEFAGD
jgi:hypothetical protein